MAFGTLKVDKIEGDGGLTLDLSGTSVALGSNLVPDADSSRNIGTNTVRWQNIYADNVYTGDLHMKNDKGDWTMIEAEDYLTIRNNKNGKVFRLLMEEVES